MVSIISPIAHFLRFIFVFDPWTDGGTKHGYVPWYPADVLPKHGIIEHYGVVNTKSCSMIVFVFVFRETGREGDIGRRY